MPNLNTNDSSVLFRCTTCGFEEFIPTEVVHFFDICDGGDTGCMGEQ
jgi:hypothetical protein